MTKVKSISIEGSEPTPIVDKGIDEAQSRNTVANTDVVKVQDGNGVWHAIPFNKFIEVATPLVASIMNNLNLQGNIAKFLGLNANGAPGVSSLADAAAALGVNKHSGYVTEIFANNGYNIWSGQFSTSTTDRPTGTGTGFFVRFRISNSILYFAIAESETHKLFIKCTWFDTNWIEVI